MLYGTTSRTNNQTHLLAIRGSQRSILCMDIMAEATKKPRKALSEDRKRKRESNRARDRKRVSLGLAFTRWRELKVTKGCKSDAELAFFLLDQSVITYQLSCYVLCCACLMFGCVRKVVDLLVLTKKFQFSNNGALKLTLTKGKL